jgi:hypothetical protein
MDEMTFICGQNGQMLYTEDGVSWDMEDTGVSETLLGASTPDIYSSLDWAVGTGCTILRLNNNFGEWQEALIYDPEGVLTGGEVLYDIEVVWPGPFFGTGVGSGGTILHKHASVYCWIPCESGTNRTLNDVAASDVSRYFFVVGDDESSVTPEPIADGIRSEGPVECTTATITLSSIPFEGVVIDNQQGYQISCDIRIIDASGRAVGEIKGHDLTPGINMLSQNMLLDNCISLPDNGIYFIILLLGEEAYSSSFVLMR